MNLVKGRRYKENKIDIISNNVFIGFLQYFVDDLNMKWKINGIQQVLVNLRKIVSLKIYLVFLQFT